MPEAVDLENVAQQVAENVPVDWDAAEAGALTDDDRELLSRLRIVAQIASLHAGDDAAGSDGGHSARVDDNEPARRRWGQLRLLELVGEGTFGELYRAWDETLDREVALKLIKPGVVDSASALREGRLLARVRHPNVVTVFGADEIDGRVGIWMEFVHGRTLSQMVTGHGAYNASEAAAIGRDVCRALAAVHNAGLFHRDVKARNVMRERGGRIILTDFGAGLERTQISGAGSLAGTPHYLAPEILLGGATASIQTDIYAVGVLLFRLVADAYPVEGATLDDVREGHRSGRRRLLRDLRSDLPNAFVSTVERATAVDPAARFETAGALEQRLIASGVAVEAQDVTARSTPAVPNPIATSPIRRWWPAAAALLIAVAVFGYWQIVRPPQFNLGPEHLATQNDPEQYVVAWASGFHSGAPEEGYDRFSFTVTNNFPSLFRAQPWIAPDGNLWYAAATNAIGIALVTVTLTDRGRPFGLSATSAPKTFEIRVTPPRHPPVAGEDRFEAVAGSPLVVGRQPMPQGLRHWWRGDATAVDSVANGADGTLRNGASFGEGRSGQAFAFDGVDDVITAGRTAGNFGADDFSISFLVRTSAQSEQPIVNKHTRCNLSESYWAAFLSYPSNGSSGGGLAFTSISTDLKTQGRVFSVRRVNDGVFHSVAIIRSGTILSIYIDGVFDNMTVTPAPMVLSNATELTFGTGPCVEAIPPKAPGQARNFAGLLDEVAFFDRALTVPDIQRMHHHGVLINDANSENDLMTAVLAEGPAHGKLSLSPEGTFSYQPNPGFTGVDRFRYHARNAVASSGPNTSGDLSPVATVTIEVAPQPSPAGPRR